MLPVPWARALVALAILKELLLAILHRRRDGAVVSRRDERQPPQDGGDGNDVDDGPWLRLIQLLRSALARLPPPGGGCSCGQKTLGLLSVFTLFMCGVHIVCTKSLRCTSCHAFSPARGIVVEAIDHGTVAVHQNQPAISILLVRLHPDTEQEHHAPVPAILQGCVEFGPGPLKERVRGNEEEKVHPHLLVVVPERPAVDKLLAKEVLVPDTKAAEDLNLGPITTPAAVVADSPLNAPHQPLDLTLTKLIVFSIRRREPKASKPVAAIVMQVMGDFIPEVFQNPMFRYVIGVCLRRLRGPDCFAQGCKPIVTAMVITAMQAMSHPVRSLCPPPDIALECIR